MDSNMPAGRVWCFTLLFLSYIIFTTSIVTQDPVLACVGDTITVSCDLTVPNPGDSFLSFITNFIVGSSVAISDTIVNGNGTQGGVDLSRFTADSPIGSTENVVGTLTLLSYTLADNGLTLGCSNEYLVDGNSSNRASLTETLNIQQANPPSPPVPLSADFDSTTCSGSVELAWTAGASDRPIETYFLYLNGVDIASISSDMNSYSHAITLQIDTDYVYSVLAMSCAGNSTLATADNITIGVPSSPNVTLSETAGCLIILISWTTDSYLDVIEYSVYRNNTFLLNTTGTQYTDTELNSSTVYEYSVIASNCLGSSVAGVKSVSINVPSSPVVTLSQTDNDCANTLISWDIPDSDKAIISYTVLRDSFQLATIADNQYTDDIVLIINEVYEYSVRASSCAGYSTGERNISIETYSLSVNPLSLSYNEPTGEIYFNWTLNTNTGDTTILLISYSLDLTYTHSQSNIIYKFSDTYSFSQLSNNTNYNQTITPHNFSTEIVDTEITACLLITEQCGQLFSGVPMCADYDSVPHPTPIISQLGAIVGGVIGGILFILLILLIILLIIGICICCLKNGAGYSIFGAKKKDKNSNQLTLEETFYTKVEKSGKAPPAETEQKQILYADIDHITPKPGSVKRPEPTEETHYMSIQPPIDGPST